MTRFDQIEFACLTDVGVRRSHNQDNHAVQLATDDEQWRQRGHLFLVADGMGAHAVGEKASEQAAAVIPHTYHKHAHQGPVSSLRKSFVEANASIHACGQQNREFEGMGTTSTALLLRPEGAWVGHVGDSRCYRIRGESIEQLSYDHSLLWEVARQQKLDPGDVHDVPSNVIHRCLGPEPFVQVDVEGPHPLLPGDVFLLCSDGLSGQVSDPEIGAVASNLPPAEACRFLIDLANLRGGPDNITVLIVRLAAGPNGDGTAPVLAPRRPWPSVPWWLLSLSAGTALALAAAALQAAQWSTLAVLTFLAAAASIIAGLLGLGVQYQREKNRSPDEDDLPPPRIHRRAPCQVDGDLLDRLFRLLDPLRQHAEERHWDVDRGLYEGHRTQAEDFRRQHDLPGALREYCRAMIPLTQALHKHRNKEEVFQPIWDRAR